MHNSISKPRSLQVQPESPDQRVDHFVRIIAGVLDAETSSTDNFFDIGGNSLHAARVSDRVQEELGLVLSLADFNSATNIEDLAKAAAAPTNPESANHESSLKIGPSLYCLNYGPTLAYHVSDADIAFSEYGDDLIQEIDGVNSIERVAHEYIRELKRVRPQGPYGIAGYCAHAVVAFEMAIHLQSIGEQVPLLIMYDPMWNWDSTFRRIAMLSRRLVRPPKLPSDWTLRRRIGQRVRSMSWWVRSIARGKPPVNAAPPVIDRIQPGWEQIARLIERSDYKPSGDYYGHMTVVMSGKPSDQLSVEQLGWFQRARGPQEVHLLPARHLDMFREPHIRSVANITRGSIEGSRTYIASETNWTAPGSL